MNSHPKRLLDIVVTILISTIALVIFGQVIAQVLLQYMLHLIIAASVVIIVWIGLRALLMKRMW